MNNDHRTLKEESELAGLLSYIENNTAKENFIAWLNTQQGKTYSEEDTWEHIKAELQSAGAIKFKDLQTYAKTLGSEQDVENLLKQVKKTTDHAERTVERLSYLSDFKKFSVAIGGAVFFVGVLVFLFGVSLFFHFIGKGLNVDLITGTGSFSIFIGILDILAGLLLATR